MTYAVHIRRAMLPMLLALLAPGATAAEDFEQTFNQGVKLIQPYMALTDKAAAVDARSAAGQKDLRDGIALLTRVTEHNPKNFAAFWFIGKAWQAQKDHPKAYAAFKQSLALKPANTGIPREFVREAICVGATGEAVTAATEVVAAHPADVALQTHLGLALLADHQVPKAKAAIDRALALAPNDPFAQGLAEEVAALQGGAPPAAYCMP